MTILKRQLEKNGPAILVRAILNAGIVQSALDIPLYMRPLAVGIMFLFIIGVNRYRYVYLVITWGSGRGNRKGEIK